MMGYLDTEMIDCIRTKQSDDKFVLCILKVRNDFMINNLNEELTELGGQAHFFTLQTSQYYGMREIKYLYDNFEILHLNVTTVITYILYRNITRLKIFN